MNRNNRVLGLAHVSQGGVTGTVLDPRVIFSLALKANATGIVVAHNQSFEVDRLKNTISNLQNEVARLKD